MTAKTIQRTEYPHIVEIVGVNGGQATLEGTRIAVWHLAGYYHRVGMTVEDIVAEWSYLTPAQVFSALAYYHDHKEETDAVREQNSYDEWVKRHAHATA